MQTDMRGQAGDGLSEASTGKLVHDFFDESKRVLAEGRRLLQAEIDTARRELRQEAKKAGPAAGFFGAGGVLLHVAVLIFAFTLASLLTLLMPQWLAFLITGAVLAIAGGVLLSSARKKLRTVALKDGQTIHNLQEDQRWAKGLTQSVRSNLRQDT
jgi:putative superfamily III holin-X